MNKILRYSFVALLAMVFGNVLADEVTMKYSGSTTENMSADGSNEAATVGLSDSEWSVIASKGAASNAPGLNKAGDIRLYWHADGGNTITVSSLTNTLINNIAITFTGESYSNVSVMVGENEASSVDGKYSINSTSFTLGNANTSNVQVRISEIVITYGGAASTKTATSIKFEDGYKTQIGQGPDDMFPEVGSTVALPAATVMAGDVTVGNTVEWSLQVTSWKGKEGKPEPSISDGKINVADGYGVLEVTASYAGNDIYEASSKKYTLTVYNTYGLLKEMAKDIADPDCTKDDEDDADGKPVFYFFRNIDAEGFPVATSTVTYVNGKYIYLTDGDGANLLFYGTNTQNLKQGDVISGNVSNTNLGGFWGNLKRYKKLPEFAFTDMNVKVESEGATVTPTTITIDQLKDNINAYVTVENAEYVSASSKNLTFKVGEAELAVYNQFNVSASALEVGAKYTVEGMVSVNKKDKNTDAVYQLYPISFTKTGEAGINEMKVNTKFEGKTYNMAGQMVTSSYKGLVIMNGRKVVMK